MPKDVNSRSRKFVQQLVSKYGNWVQDSIPFIFEEVEKGATIRTAVQKAWAKFGIGEKIEAVIVSNILEVSASGLGVAVDQIPSEIETAILQSTWAGDGITRIKRIQDLSAKQRAIVQNEISKAVRSGDSVLKLARRINDAFADKSLIPVDKLAGDRVRKDLIELAQKGSSAGLSKKDIQKLQTLQAQIRASGGLQAERSLLRSSYLEVLKAVENGVPEKIFKAVEVATKDKARYLAERIARTELGRANWESQLYKYDSNPEIVGMRYYLSSAHNETDICDLHTSVDFGLGAGVYPLDSLPSYPFHPNCLCNYEPVFADEIAGKDFKVSPRAINKALEKIPDSERKIVGLARSEELKNKKTKVLDILPNYNKPEKPNIIYSGLLVEK